jgi:hypothetical protein
LYDHSCRWGECMVFLKILLDKDLDEKMCITASLGSTYTKLQIYRGRFQKILPIQLDI